uniref:Uncharacterized protein n=1 Tax=Caenorhabditis japonica TaxID=281687 RepID=A0A8R1ER24_CAEJA
MNREVATTAVAVAAARLCGLGVTETSPNEVVLNISSLDESSPYSLRLLAPEQGSKRRALKPHPPRLAMLCYAMRNLISCLALVISLFLLLFASSSSSSSFSSSYFFSSSVVWKI